MSGAGTLFRFLWPSKPDVCVGRITIVYASSREEALARVAADALGDPYVCGPDGVVNTLDARRAFVDRLIAGGRLESAGSFLCHFVPAEMDDSYEWVPDGIDEPTLASEGALPMDLAAARFDPSEHWASSDADRYEDEDAVHVRLTRRGGGGGTLQ